MVNIIPAAWANVKANDELICVQTYSGYGSCRADYKGAMHLLEADVSDNDLGEALLDALARSRFVLPEPRNDVWIHPEALFDADLYDIDQTIRRYDEWVSKLITQFGYKNKRSLFKNMRSCGAEKKEGQIEIVPTRHEKLEAWSGDGFTDADKVIIAANVLPVELGCTLRMVLSECT